MIVDKPISSVKVGNTISRLTVGKPVPENVLKFWKKTGQFEPLKNGGFISEKVEESKPQINQNKTEENKYENKSMSEKK